MLLQTALPGLFMNKILSAIYDHAARTPEQVALQSEAIALTYSQLVERVTVLAHWLQTQDVRRIGLWGENSIEWIIADLAAWQANVTLVPLPLFFSKTQLQHVIDLAQLDYVLVCGDIAPVVSASKRVATPIECLSCDELRRPTRQPGQVDNTIAKITFTSGTTGNPKGVCLSHHAIEHVTQALAEKIYCDSTKGVLNKHLNLLPLSTLLENVAGVYVPLYLGKSVVVLAGKDLGFLGSSQLSLPVLLKVLHQYQPNSLIVLPQILHGLVAAASQGYPLPPSLKFVAVGGAHTPPQLIQQARSLNIPVYEGYGLSECASVVSLNHLTADKPGSVGKPLAHVQVKIQHGVILVRGNGLNGYLGQPATHDEWFDTGDLGHIDEEGFLFVTGRKKNLLISSYGRNISPEWIEAELLLGQHVEQAMVVGDAQAYCCAIVVPAEPDCDPRKILNDINRINKTLPDYARIHKIILAREPFSTTNHLLTDNGRLRREAILSRYAQAIDALYTEHLSSQHPGVIYDLL